MIFQASYVSTTMAMFQVDFFDSNGESMKGLESLCGNRFCESRIMRLKEAR